MEMTLDEKLIESALDHVAAEIRQVVPQKQIIDYPSEQCYRLGRFGANDSYSLYFWTDDKNELYAIQKKGVTLAWIAPESAEKLADMINDDLGR